MRVCMRYTELPDIRCLQVIPHSLSKNQACWVSEVGGSQSPPILTAGFSGGSGVIPEKKVTQYRHESYSTSGRQSAALWEMMDFPDQV